jgi:hypothetical protein
VSEEAVRRPTAIAAIIAGAVLCAICAAPVEGAKAVEIEIADREVPDDRLLDVGIQVLEPGLPEEDQDGLEERGIYAGVRKAEARFIAYHLKNTLESTGLWGAVRVVPSGIRGGEVTVSGEILASNGKMLAVSIRVVDARGQVWHERKYRRKVDPSAYAEGTLEREDGYQDLYDRIANDLIDAKRRLDPQELRELREINWLRFASDLVPAAYADYLSTDRKGRYRIERLPAVDDPMLQRVARVRERDYLFVDTLNEYYADLYARMAAPYDDWRSNSYDEQLRLEEIRREARLKKIFGGILLMGAAFADAGSSASRAARDAAAIGGAVVLKDGIDQGKEAKIHREALREMAASFDAEIEPVVVEVEGQTLRLEGSAEAQFAEWRRLLSEIFGKETGLPVGSDDGLSPDRAGARRR